VTASEAMLRLQNSTRRRAWNGGARQLAGVLFFVLVATGQTGPPPLSFEVTSVKRRAEPSIHNPHSGIGRDGIRYGSFTLRLLLMRAYEVASYQIVGPSWLDAEYYDVEAIAPKGSTRSQMLTMFQNLLVERFQMKLHRETKDFHGYLLTIGKNGPRLRELPDSAEAKAVAGRISFSSKGHLEAHTIPALCKMLSNFMGQPVQDATGLKGAYEIKLDVNLDDLPGLAPFRFASGAGTEAPQEAVPQAQEPSGPSIFSAVKELGLDLERRNVPLECIVVEKAEKTPTAN